MPLYVAFLPDIANGLSKRLAARPAHVAKGAESRKDGTIVFGRGFLSEEYSHTEGASPPAVETGQANPGMAGSWVMYRFPTIDGAWARIKSDPYWIEGVWDKERCTVKELMESATDDSLGPF